MKGKMSDPLPTLINAKLEIQKLRVAAEVRLAHLRKNGREDPETKKLHKRQVSLEKFIDGEIAKLTGTHPAYPWFSRIKGIGKENIGNVVGLIDIDKDDTASSLWKFAGFDVQNGKAPKRQKGVKLTYNSQLRSMCWRLGSSLLKAGLRQRCHKCGHLFGSDHDYKNDPYDEGCPKCGSTIFSQVAVSKFAEYYVKEKEKYYQKYTNKGFKIMPTPSGRVCPECGKEVKEKATKYCPNIVNGEKCGTLLTKKQEPEGVIFEGHLHNMALRKMIKLFLSLLWVTWRKAKGLPTRVPYPKEYLGHDHMFSPEDLCDK